MRVKVNGQVNPRCELHQGDRKIVLEISEHDASRLLALVQAEINQAEPAWLAYWQRLAGTIAQSIERSALDFLGETGPDTDPNKETP